MKAYALEVSLSLPLYVFPHSLRVAALLYRAGLLRGPAMFSNLVPSRYQFQRVEYAFRDDLSASVAMKSRRMGEWVQQVSGTVYVVPLGGGIKVSRGRVAVSQYNVVEVRGARIVELRRIQYPWNHVSLANPLGQHPPQGVVAEEGVTLVCHQMPRGKLCAKQPLVYRGEPQQRVETVFGPLPWRPAPFPDAEKTMEYQKAWAAMALSAKESRQQGGHRNGWGGRRGGRRGGRDRWRRRSYYR